MPSSSDPPAPNGHHPRRRLRSFAIAAGIAVAAAAVFAATGPFASPGKPPALAVSGPTQLAPSPEREGDVFGTGIAGSCVETYSAPALAQREFAFDGTVVAIGKGTSAAEVANPYVPVTFAVSRWFRGGPGEGITVEMFPPDSFTSAAHATYAVGSRLLVSGEDRWGRSPMTSPIVWACGFTRWYNHADAQSWDEAFR